MRWPLERDLQMITHACGLKHPSQLTREHVLVNVSPGVRKPLVELFPYPEARQQNEVRRAGNWIHRKIQNPR